MKKILGLGLIIVLSLGLTACGGEDKKSESSSDKKQETEVSVPKDESKSDVGFKDGVLKIDMATVKILSEEVLQPDDSLFRDKAQIAFTFEVTNDSKEAIQASTVWIACFQATQETENTIKKLDVGMDPQDEKFAEFKENMHDDIKPGGTVKAIIAYDLNDTTTPVVLKATQGISGKELGEMTYKLG